MTGIAELSVPSRREFAIWLLEAVPVAAVLFLSEEARLRLSLRKVNFTEFIHFSHPVYIAGPVIWLAARWWAAIETLPLPPPADPSRL